MIDLLPYARAAEAAYRNATIDAPSTDTQVTLYRDGPFPIIAFRGTTSLRDWETNISGGFVALRDQVLVREGFADAWMSVHDQLAELVSRDKFYDDAGGLHITGHSLGGALATVAALDWALVEKITLVTFGAPRCLHKGTPLHHNVSSYRVVNNNDVVVRVPLEAQGYVHRGRRLYFDESGQLHTDIDRWHEFWDRVDGRMQDLGELGTDGVKDHDMAEYLRLCEALAA